MALVLFALVDFFVQFAFATATVATVIFFQRFAAVIFFLGPVIARFA